MRHYPDILVFPPPPVGYSVSLFLFVPLSSNSRPFSVKYIPTFFELAVPSTGPQTHCVPPDFLTIALFDLFVFLGRLTTPCAYPCAPPSGSVFWTLLPKILRWHLSPRLTSPC